MYDDIEKVTESEVRIPRWALELTKYLMPVTIALIAAYLQIQSVISDVNRINKTIDSIEDRLKTVEQCNFESRRNYDVLNAQILARLDSIEKQLNELKTQK